jgi:hypothetical protein
MHAIHEIWAEFTRTDKTLLVIAVVGLILAWM